MREEKKMDFKGSRDRHGVVKNLVGYEHLSENTVEWSSNADGGRWNLWV